MHRAARIMSSAHGGQVVLSRETVELLPAGVFALRDLGDHRFKDLGTPERVFQLGEGEHPRLKSLYRVTLPVPATPFLGREAELATVVELLTHPATRVLTLTGPGGTGKTRLALQAAAEASDRFVDGITWVALAPLRDPALMLPTIARALDLTERADEPLAATLTRALLGKKALLLLDNLEHLLPRAAQDLAALTTACPTLRLLTTSRESLRVQAETVWPVPPMSETDGEQLFLERAHAAGVDLTRDETVRVLCRRLDDLPLALELAAARTTVFTPTQLLDRIEQRLDLLKGGRDADPRQQTLRAAIEWSYQLLDPAEQSVYRALSVFAGGCTYDAAEHVTGADPDTLQSLLDKSLLRRRNDNDQPRYWMLETIREHAADTLATSEEEPPARAVHAGWYALLAHPDDGNPWSATTDRVDALEADLDNLRVAFTLYETQGDATRALEMAVGLFPLWEIRDRIVEGDHWLETALALPGGERTTLRAMAFGARCSLGYHLSRDGRELLALAREGVEIMREAGSPADLAQALTALSWAQRRTDPSAALRPGEEALAVARDSGSLVDLRGATHNVGELLRDLGAFDEAVRLLTEAICLSRELDDPGYVGATTHSLGDLELDRGNDARAWRLYLEAGAISLDGRVPAQAALCVGGLATVAARSGQPDLAHTLWAALENWERERGVLLADYERTRYEQAISGSLSVIASPPIGLAEAIELAGQSSTLIVS